jgi:bifunctional enzyme CysN/CysC
MSAALQALAPMTATPDSLLRLITCGSVDDGKSTLLGRLLFDSNAVPDDQLSALDRDSKRFGTQGSARDFALLVDGLAAEREQGITIDIAWRYFSTPNRAFILADAPGHEQYTRNMATGASNVDLPIILTDARKGVLPQTRRHSYIVAMLGVRHVVLAVNKMDLVGFDLDVFHRIEADYRSATAALGFVSVTSIPLCAREGDNVVIRSDRTPWFTGLPLLAHLETTSIQPNQAATDTSFRLPVQYVNRPNPEFRGYAGTLAGGVMQARRPIRVLPGGHRSRIARIVSGDGDLSLAVAGQAVTITLAQELDIARGDVIVAADDLLTATQSVTARLLWMVEQPLTPGQNLQVRIGTAIADARVARLHHAIDIHDFSARPADVLAMNEIGLANLEFDRPLAAADYATDRTFGSLVLIDRMTNRTVALGVIEHTGVPSPSDQVPFPVRRDRLHRVIGTAGSTKRAVFLQRMVGRILRGLVLYALVVVLSGNKPLGAVIGVADVGLSPLLNHAVASIWRHWRHLRGPVKIVGSA